MMNLLYVHWDFKPEIIESPITVVYYGISWALSFLIGNYIVKKMMDKDNAPDHYSDKILLYMLLGGVLGARLGHVIFYDPQYYFTSENWAEIFKIWKGGLASHGGAIGILIANYLYKTRVSKKSYTWSLDKVVVATALAACLIRVGNLTNSEIIGVESESSSAFFFEKPAKDNLMRLAHSQYSPFHNLINVQSVEIESLDQYKEKDGFSYPVAQAVLIGQVNQSQEQANLKLSLASFSSFVNANYDQREDHLKGNYSDNNLSGVINNSGQVIMTMEVLLVPRVPAQLLEAVVYLIIFIMLFIAYWRLHWYKYDGLLFGLFLILVFGARFIIEFWKEHQAESVDDTSFLNMGQYLSIPAILVGVIFIVRALKKGEVDTRVNKAEVSADK